MFNVVRLLTTISVIALFVLPIGAHAQEGDQVVCVNKDAPIHIGDNKGSMGDVTAFRSRQPATRFEGGSHGCTFELPKSPAAEVAVFADVFSLTQHPCPTVLNVNDKSFDLRKQGGDVGEGKTTKVRLKLPADIFRSGENRVEVKEEYCNMGGLYLNDSVIVYLAVQFAE